MKKKEFKINEIKGIAKDVVSLISKNESDKATVVALSGDLGAGKTTLTQAIARELGVKENLISPTFVIMKNYKLPNKLKANKLIHIDAYRLEKDSELLRLGWQEILADSKNLVFIEWPEKVEKLIPKNAIKINLSHKDEETRRIKI